MHATCDLLEIIGGVRVPSGICAAQTVASVRRHRTCVVDCPTPRVRGSKGTG